MSYPPGPPGRLRLNHSAVFPSGLKVSRISSYCVDATPGARRSAGPTIRSTRMATRDATQQPAASRPAAPSCLSLEVADPVGFPTAPAIGRCRLFPARRARVMRDQITRVWIDRPSCWSSPKKRPTPAWKPPRSGAPIRVGSRPSTHQLSQCRSAAFQARMPMPPSGAPGMSIRLSPTLPNPPKTGQLCRVPLNASHASLPASRARRRRWRTFQWPTRKSKSPGASGSFGSGEGPRQCGGTSCASSLPSAHRHRRRTPVPHGSSPWMSCQRNQTSTGRPSIRSVPRKLPASPLKAPRTGASIWAGLRPSIHQIDHVEDTGSNARTPRPCRGPKAAP